MSSLGNDYTLGTVIRYIFNTINQSKVPATPSVGLAFAVYKNSSVVEYTLPGANVVTNFDGLVGSHRITIDTSDPFFVAGEDYTVKFTAGTVDGIDLSRNVVFRFSIENQNNKVNTVQLAGQTVTAGSAVAFPASVANEVTVSLRATQISVNNIPTNPLLTTDTRLNNLNAPIGSIPTNPLLTNDTRLNNLDFSIAAVNTAIGNLNNLSALINLYGSPLLEIPDAGSTLYSFTIVVRDNEGKLVNLDSLPTVTAANGSGTSRSANLSVVSNPATGRYTFTYSVASTHPQENLRIVGSGTVSAEARYIEWVGSVVNYDTLTTLQAVQTTVNSIDSRLPSLPAAVSNIPTASQNAVATWSALHTDNWPNNSFGSGVLISHSTPRTVAVTGSFHIAADIHEFQPGVITEVDFATDALSARVLAADGVTEIVTGVWSRDLSTFGANTAGNNLFTILTRIPAALPQLVTDLSTMLVSSGTALVKWTATALSLAPAGGGGGGGSTTVSPEAFINLDDTLLEKNIFVFFNNEIRTYLVSLVEGNFDGQPMTFCIEKSDKTTLVAVTGLSSATNSVSVTIPSTAEQTDKCMQWSLRDSATGRIILYGPAVQKYAAFNN